MDGMISCLCVTYNRPEFHDFVLYNFFKQTWANKELVIVDGSEENHEVDFSGKQIQYIHIKNEINIPKKRNIAIEAAKGEFITWFDDDDWQHPRKCEVLVDRLMHGEIAAGCSESLFFDLKSCRYSKRACSGTSFFNSVGVRKDALKDLRFNEMQICASDNEWMLKLRRTNMLSTNPICDPLLFFWLCHTKNICNKDNRQLGRCEVDGWLLSLLGSDRPAFFTEIGKIRARLGYCRQPAANG
jgi:glycosyltransferase involved in cell wall biosynthesis